MHESTKRETERGRKGTKTEYKNSISSTKHKVSFSAYCARTRGVTYEGSRFLNLLSGSFQYCYSCTTDGKDVLFAETDILKPASFLFGEEHVIKESASLTAETKIIQKPQKKNKFRIS